jgi:serine-type D-Ala-D-Ala carboxypeptidase (penicillin-binding protein 5/6)
LFLKHSFVYPATSDELEKFNIKYKLKKPNEDGERARSSEQIAGHAEVFLDGKVIKEIPIYYKNLPEKEKGFFSSSIQIFLSIIGVNKNG